MQFFAGEYSEGKEQDVRALYQYLNDYDNASVEKFTGEIKVVNGAAISGGYTLINSRSFAEDVSYFVGSVDDPFTGTLKVNDGEISRDNIVVSGKSLVHSASLTAIAFTKGYFGEFGKYIVSVGLLLFAFSTAIAWSYYGDRAMTYLLGPASVMPYRVIYVAAFFWAAISDTTLVWALSAVAIVVMTLPNLFGIMMLRKEMKQSVNEYWEKVNK
jgi:AGCS family alanine or glycine:cation symporter